MKKIVSFITAICMLGLSVPHLDSTYNSNYAVAEDNLSDFSETIPEGYFQNQKDLSSFVIPSSVEKIEKRAFAYCENLNTISIPDSVKYIGYEAFVGCESLNNVVIPDSVTDIKDYTFRESGLESITLSKNITRLSTGMFFECTSLKEFAIPDNIQEIGNSTFYNCTNLASITIPESVTSIKECAFSGCSKLYEVTIPESVSSINNSAFAKCTGLKSIIILNPDCKIEDYALSMCDTGTIYGYKGSTAQKYAEKYNYNFEIISSIAKIENRGMPYTPISHYASVNPTTPRLTVSKIGFLSASEAAGKTVTIELKIDGADQKYCATAFHIDWDERLSLVQPSTKTFATLGEAGENLIVEQQKNGENGIFLATAAVSNIGKDGVLWKIDLKLPDNAKEGDIYPIDVYNAGKKGAQDIFNNADKNLNGNIMQDYFFTEGIYSKENPSDDAYLVKAKATFADGYIAIDKNYKPQVSSATTTVTTSAKTTTTTTTATTTTPKAGEDKDPIIIIPGIMGSRLYSEPYCLSDCQIWDPPKNLTFLDLAKNIKADKELYVNSPYLNQNELDEELREYGTLDHLKVTDKDKKSDESANYGELGIIDQLCKEFPNRPIHVFSYDWRKSNSENAEELNQFLDVLFIAYGQSYKKVDIVAHSMGGLLTSRYISLYGTGRLDKVITCGTPYEGSPHLFEAVEQGKIVESDLQNLALSALGHLSRDIIAEFDGVLELLPSQNYCSIHPMIEYVLCDEASTEEDEYTDSDQDESMYYKEHEMNENEYRNMINEEFGINAIANAFKFKKDICGENDYNVLFDYDNAYFILGQNRATVQQVYFIRNYKYNNDNSLLPYYIEAVKYTKSGDGTVPYLSSSIYGRTLSLDKNHQFTVESLHMDLMKNKYAIDCICKILNNEKPNQYPYFIPDDYMEIVAACPVDVEIGTGDDRLCSALDDLSLTSSFGRLDIVGKNNDKKMLCIDENTGLDINLMGTDTGTMDFSIRHFSGEDE
ncbi:leucine-rich repeat protein, partial [uncultured Ruminococcus sp.]|uniref:leucine-rich repeat protein n=1 Tax=uncultured Ruminococcus sp. TaxID=165186 RepID=UPI002600B948